MPSKHNAKEFLNDGYAHDPCNVHAVVDPQGGCYANNFNQGWDSIEQFLLELVVPY